MDKCPSIIISGWIISALLGHFYDLVTSLCVSLACHDCPMHVRPGVYMGRS